MGSLFTLDAPLRLLSVKCWKKTYKSKFQVVRGQIAHSGRAPLMNALCHGYNCDILGNVLSFEAVCLIISRFSISHHFYVLHSSHQFVF